MDRVLTHAEVVRWRTAVFAIFLASGMSVATWASRTPAIRDALGIENWQLGVLLLGAGVASISGLSLAPAILTRFGARKGMLSALTVVGFGVALIGVGTDALASYGAVLLGLALFGMGNGAVDSMMNVEGAAIERESGRTLLPLFHAFFSLGTVVGAAFGFLAVQWGLDVLLHCAVSAALIVLIAFISIRNVPARESVMDDADQDRRHWRERLTLALSAWREPRTYALGVIMLGMAFAEGGANDWLPLAMDDGHGAGEALGAAALAVFSVSMTTMRVLGGPLVDRFGRVSTLRVLAAVGAAGLLLFILAPNIPLAFVGAALWGLGVSLGFPLGMSAAADDPALAAARVTAAATIGYIAFLCGPPLLGFISDHIGLLPTLFILVALMAASGLFSGAARPLAAQEPSSTSR